jgi:MerR family transcriptional regulator, copper efflux regulator
MSVAETPEASMTIGQLSAETGVPASTIRFWERKGLLSPAFRQSGQRRYASDAVRGVVMLRLLQEVGLTLADIRRFREERAITPRSWHTLVAEKLTDVERQIAALDHARKMLTLALDCHHDDLLACPAFQDWFAGYLATFPERQDSGASQSTPSGGTRMVAEAGRPCHSSSTASTEPRLPTPLPP